MADKALPGSVRAFLNQRDREEEVELQRQKEAQQRRIALDLMTAAEFRSGYVEPNWTGKRRPKE